MQNEVQMLGSLSHPNIMRFIAITLNPPMIIMQYYSHGSLFSLLQVSASAFFLATCLVMTSNICPGPCCCRRKH